MAEALDPAAQLRLSIQYCLRLLGRRAYSQSELTEKLRQRLVPAEVIDGAIAYLVDANLVNDAEMASQWFASRQRSRPQAAWLARRELSAKGIDRQLIDEATRQPDHSDDDQAARYYQSLERRYAAYDAETAKRRSIAALQRRGFSLEVIGRILNG